ncbi:MAG: hypothetical protein MRERC_10c001, partial [Mycoplasmataceae bacterium RC_NB112A]
MAKEKKFPLKNIFKGLDIKDLSVGDMEKILQDFLKKTQKLAKATEDSMKEAEDFRGNGPAEDYDEGYRGFLQRELEIFALFNSPEVNRFGNVIPNHFILNRHYSFFIPEFRDKIELIEDSLKKIQSSFTNWEELEYWELDERLNTNPNVIKRLMIDEPLFAHDSPVSISARKEKRRYLVRLIYNDSDTDHLQGTRNEAAPKTKKDDLLTERKKFLEALTKAREYLEIKKKKIISIIELPAIKERDASADVRRVIAKWFAKSMDHKRITELDLKKWENKWPYEQTGGGKNLDDILANANFTGLSEAIKKYEKKLEENLEDILLIIGEALDYNRDNAAFAIANAWKRISPSLSRIDKKNITQLYRRRRKLTREQHKEDINIFLGKLREKQKKITELKNELNNQIVQNQKLETHKWFLIKRAVKLAREKIDAEKELARRAKLSQHEIDLLEAKVGQLEANACSGCHEPTHTDYDQIKKDKQNLARE